MLGFHAISIVTLKWSTPNSHLWQPMHLQLALSVTLYSCTHVYIISPQITTLYRDPLKRGWEDKTPYRWNIQYSSQSMCMRLASWWITGTALHDTLLLLQAAGLRREWAVPGLGLRLSVQSNQRRSTGALCLLAGKRHLFKLELQESWKQRRG